MRSEEVIFLNEENRKAMTPRQVTEIYGIAEGTLANYRYQNKGPRYYKSGRKVLYWTDELESWLRRQPVLTVDDHDIQRKEG